MATKNGTLTFVKRENAPARKPALTTEQLTEEIRVRAYHLALARGNAPANPMDDWLKAEKEVKSKLGIAG